MQNITVTFVKTGHKMYLELERRVTYLTGLSGSGKTSFVRVLFAEEKRRVLCTSSLPLRAIEYGTGSVDFITAIKNTIVIIDDYASLQSTNFWQVVNTCAVSNNIWIVIIGREHFFEDLGIPYIAFNSVYVMQALNGEFFASKLAIPSKCSISSYKFDKIFTEDSKSGFYFVRKLNSTGADVESLNGAQNLIKRLMLLQESGVKEINIFAFVDMASFGVDVLQLQELMGYKEFVGYNLCVMSDYECFEELLLRTNMLVDKFNNVFTTDEANNFLSWEAYFESKLDELTKNKLYRAYHGSMTRCYLEGCCIFNDGESLQGTKCEFYNSVTGDKFEFLLKDTKYERLLDFH